MYNSEYDKYNHISIFFFLFPLLYSYYLNCQLYLIINTIWLVTGFTYHYSIRETSVLTNKASVLTNKASVLTNKTSVLINKASVLTNKASVLPNKTIIFRYIDIIAVHTLIPYIMYYSTYNNIFYYSAMGCVLLLVSIYYINIVKLSHSIIHIIASIGVFNAINSCYLNKNTCHLCE